MACQYVRYSKENLKIHTGSPPSLPSLPYPPLLFFPSLCPFPSLPISLFPLEVGPLNPARGSGERCKLYPSGVWGGAPVEIDFGAF